MKRYVLILTLAILLNCTSCGKQAEPTEPVLPSESETVLPSESESESESDATQEPSETEPETEEDIPPIEPIGEYASAQEAFAGLPAHYADYSSRYEAYEPFYTNIRIASTDEPQALFFDKIDDFAVEMYNEYIDKVYAFGQLYKIIGNWLGTLNRYCPYFVISDDFAVLFIANCQVAFVYEGGYEIYPNAIDKQNRYNNKDLDFYVENGTMHYVIRDMCLTLQTWLDFLDFYGTEFFSDDIAMETGTVFLEDGKIVFNMENTYTYEEYVHIQDDGDIWWHYWFDEYCDKYDCDTLQELKEIYNEYKKNGKINDF